MKKLFYLLATVAVVAFVGCSKEENGDELAGTTWVSTYYFEQTGETTTLSFKSGGKFTLSASRGTLGASISGTYTYQHPRVECTYTQANASAKIIGTISGNELEALMTSSYDPEGYYDFFYKK